MFIKIELKSIMFIALCMSWQCKEMQASYNGYPKDEQAPNEQTILGFFHSYNPEQQNQIVNNIEHVMRYAAMENFTPDALPENQTEIDLFRVQKNTIKYNQQQYNVSGGWKDQYITIINFFKDKNEWTFQVNADPVSTPQQSIFSYATLINMKNHISPCIVNTKKAITPYMSPGKIFLLTLVLCALPIKNHFHFRDWIGASWVGIGGIALVIMRNTHTPEQYMKKLWDTSLVS